MNIEMANRLFNYRKQSGFSQEELAEKLGISRQAVSKWERAEACPDTDNLIRLSKLYGVPIDTLLNVDPDEVIFDEPQDSGEGENGEKVNGDEQNEENGRLFDKAGIHIVDGKDRVAIDASGIHVNDGNDEVHIGWKGVKVKRVGKSDVRVSFSGEIGDDDPDGENIHGKGEKHSHIHFKIKDRKKKYLKDLPVGLFTVIAFLILGFTLDLWNPAWILFICIPVVNSIINAITCRSIRKFNYPVFVTAAFLFIGCVYGYWHPAWVGFLTIPLFYWIF
ncbi:MAG: helix-turn-helix domain-containing protein [Eubacteriales bacterium]